MWVAVVSSPPAGAAAWPRLGPWVPRPGPVGQVARWFETIVAFAGAGRAVTETVIAFAGGKWAFLVQFVGAEVMAVS